MSKLSYKAADDELFWGLNWETPPGFLVSWGEQFSVVEDEKPDEFRELMERGFELSVS